MVEGKPYLAQSKGSKRSVNTQKSENYNHHEIGGNDNHGVRYPKQVIEFNTVERTVHPTQKPIELMAYMIRTYSNSGDLILDNTMGSGTTGVACIQEGRRFRGIEQDQKYFDIAHQRIADAIAASTTDSLTN